MSKFVTAREAQKIIGCSIASVYRIMNQCGVTGTGRPKKIHAPGYRTGVRPPTPISEKKIVGAHGL